MQGDAIRNIEGHFTVQPFTNGRCVWDSSRGSGVFKDINRTSTAILDGTSALGHIKITTDMKFDASKVVQTADENRPQNIAMHTTLYLGKYIALQEAI